MGEETNIIFKEEQRFRQKWLWYLILLSFVITFAMVGYGIAIHLGTVHTGVKKPEPVGVLAVTGIIEVIAALAVFGLFYATRLLTEVRTDGLYVRFVPFHFSYRRIGFDTLKTYAVRTYSPIGEYGGWGIRWSWRNGWAYNVSGNRGVQLELVGGKKILIGSQRPGELAGAIALMTGGQKAVPPVRP